MDGSCVSVGIFFEIPTAFPNTSTLDPSEILFLLFSLFLLFLLFFHLLLLRSLLLDQEGGDRHQAVCVLNAEVPSVRYLIGTDRDWIAGRSVIWITKMFDYINPFLNTSRLAIYKGM